MSDEKTKWERQPMRGYEKQGWVEIFAGRSPIVVADAFQRTSHGETETHFGVRIVAEALPLIEAAPDLLAALKALCPTVLSGTPGMLEAIAQAERAIAKAEGKP